MLTDSIPDGSGLNFYYFKTCLNIEGSGGAMLEEEKNGELYAGCRTFRSVVRNEAGRVFGVIILQGVRIGSCRLVVGSRLHRSEVSN
jgi:hypothetical protein